VTAINAYPVDQSLLGVRRRAAWPWLTTAMLFLAFLLATHDPYASQKWQKTVKSDYASLGADEANGRAVRQAGFLLLGVVGFALVLRKSNCTFRPNPIILFPLGMLTLWAVMSIAWSADFAVALKRQVVLICMLLAVLGVIRQFDVKTLAQIGFAIMLGFIIVGIAAEVMFAPHVNPGEEYRFAGTLHPNHAGLNAAFLLLCSLYLARRCGDRRYLLAVPVAVVVLFLTKSRTALAGVIVGAAAFQLAVRPLKQKLVLLVGVLLIGACAGVLIATDAIPNLEQTVLLNRQNSDPTTLTGRTIVWKNVWSYYSADWGTMLAGFGYGGFWDKATAEAVSERSQFKLAEAHDDYLEMMTQLGLVGLFLYLWGLFGVLWKSISDSRRFGSMDGALAIALIAFVLVHSIAESAMTLPVFTTLIFWSVLGCAALTWEDRGGRTPPRSGGLMEGGGAGFTREETR
jgi:exopolysaccharide production protein ExoQ